MATVRWHLDELTGETLTLRLYPLTSGSIANGAGGDAMTEAGDGLFSATVGESLTGWHKAYVDDAGGDVAASGFVNMSAANPVVNEAVIAVDGAPGEEDGELIITPSDPSLTTGYVTVRTSAGVEIADVTVSLEVLKLANGTTGSGIDNPLVTGITDGDGFVQFPGLPRLATYQVRIGSGKWFKGVTLDADTTPLAGVLGLAE